MSFREPFEHRDELLAAAVGAFVERGFEGASLNGIRAAARMSKGQFYHHFDGKEGLYLAVCEAMIDRKAAWFEAHPVPSTGDPFDTLAASLRAGMAYMREHPDMDDFGRAFRRVRGRPRAEPAHMRPTGDAEVPRPRARGGALQSRILLLSNS
ncbi:MAG: TetR/AcrR family transcriptional regulator [Trueperaceae bacterium]|nr:TetR/AcrR family transcriptional regulator [Trueperaceae bacterium]